MAPNDELVAKTLEMIKGATQVEKAITTSTGLRQFVLEAPAKTLYPVLSPLRNSLPRSKASGGNAVNWKVISALGLPTTVFVGEGLRNQEISYVEADKVASFKTLGLDDSVTAEAEHQGYGFEDLRARSTRSLLEAVMLMEEDALVGAWNNGGVGLGTPVTPTVATSTTGGAIAAATYNVAVVALTHMGYRGSTLVAPLAAGAQHSQKSATAAQVTTGSTSTISASTTVINGAVAYAWYCGTAGNEKLEAVTFINSVLLTALAGTGQALSAISADTSSQALGYDGMLPQIVNGGGFIKSLATGTAGTGSTLTYDSAGGIKEIDAVLKSLWDSTRVGPDEIYMNSQQALDINTKILQAGGQPVFQFVQGVGEAGQAAITASVRVVNYINKFTNGNVNLRIHPTMAPGSMMFVTRQLPPWYRNPEIDGIWDVHCLRDYYEIEYAQVQRKWEHGVYAEEVLRGYVPQANALLNNIAAG